MRRYGRTYFEKIFKIAGRYCQILLSFRKLVRKIRRYGHPYFEKDF